MFSPGRLDWILYSDATLEVVNAFVLNTDKLSARALADAGLESEDTQASDHLPVVVDVRRK